MANFMSLELSEHRFPIRFERFALRDDSGGAGWHRGGCGTDYTISVYSDCIVSVLGDRTRSSPFGVAGGMEAAPSEVEFTTDGSSWTPEYGGKQEKQLLRNGDRIRVASPGGGGFGDPLTRDLALVEQDLNLGYISRGTAEETYGVVIAEAVQEGARERFRLDPAASEERRRSRRGNNKDTAVSRMEHA
jgi:N-methylhydantoinase B